MIKLDFKETENNKYVASKGSFTYTISLWGDGSHELRLSWKSLTLDLLPTYHNYTLAVGRNFLNVCDLAQTHSNAVYASNCEHKV